MLPRRRSKRNERDRRHKAGLARGRTEGLAMHDALERGVKKPQRVSLASRSPTDARLFIQELQPNLNTRHSANPGRPSRRPPGWLLAS